MLQPWRRPIATVLTVLSIVTLGVLLVPNYDYTRPQLECFGTDPVALTGRVIKGDEPVIDEMTRPVTWTGQSMTLGDSCFEANIWILTYVDDSDSDPDEVSIDIRIPVQREPLDLFHKRWEVFFSDRFKASDLSRDFQNRPIEQMVTFDEATHEASFDVSFLRTYVYQVPGLRQIDVE